MFICNAIRLQSISNAWQVDPHYNNLFNKALDTGVEISVHSFEWRFQDNKLVCCYHGTIPIIRHDSS